MRWHYGPLPTTLLETLMLATVAVYVGARWRDGWRRPLPTVVDIPILLLLVAGAISCVVAADHKTALGLYRAFFVEPVAIYYVAVDLLRSPASLLRVIAGLALGSSVLAALNIAAFATAYAAHDVKVGAAPNAVYGDANYVAMFLEPPAAVAAGLAMFGGGRWRWLSVVWGTIVGIALLLTLSKAAYVAIAVLAVLAVLSLRRWRWRILAALVVAAGVLSQVPLIKQRWSTAADALVGRFEIYRDAAHILQQHPLFGVGLGEFHVIYRAGANEPYPHNLWLAFWVETGLLGLVAFAAVFVALLWLGWRAWPSVGGVYRAAMWGALASLIMWATHGVFDTPYFKNDMSAEFWIVAAVDLCAVASVAAAEASESRRKTPAAIPG